MKKIYAIFLLCFATITLFAQTSPRVTYFPLQDVRLLDSPFKHAQDLDKKYLLEMNADRLLAPFLRESGLTPRADSYTNWESTGLDGHIGGHYLSALSLMYASTGDAQIKARLDYMISELKRCQDTNGNGYIGGVPGGKAIWKDIKEGNIKASGFGLNDKWVPLYNIHKTYAGLRDAYIYAGSETAKEMLIKMTDWAIRLVSQLTDEQIQDMLRSEHGGLNETFADVAAITGDERYLKLAHQFSHQTILDPLLNHEDKLTGMHANTQIPKVIGFKRIADVENNDSWSEAARFFWESVVENRSVTIGGNSAYEHFHPANDFSRMIKGTQGPETCNTYNMLRLSGMLYRTSLNEKYMDYYEQALYNHILSTQHPEHGGLVYFTQMRPGHYRVYSQPHTSMWCCVGSGIENHAKYGEMIYAYTDKDLYVNLFIPSRLEWKEKGVEIIQENKFPDEAATRLTINPKKTTTFDLKLRYPDWVTKGELKVTINGKNIPVETDANGYVTINRKWKKNDNVEMEMPMHLTAVQLPDQSNYYTFMYGPIVLAAKTNADDLKGLFADDSRGGHIAHGAVTPLKEIPIVVGYPDQLTSLLQPVPGKPLTFRLTGLYPEKYAEGMELIPFFRLHESRYIIYWPQSTKAGVKELQKQMEIQEQERLKLDAATVDQVICGEQQPESDHFIQSEKSGMGFDEDEHWRDARGWFSYQMKNESGKARFLYVKYLNINRNRQCDVFINEEKVATIDLKNDTGSQLEALVFPIPESEYSKGILEVKFVAPSNLTTPKFTEVRLLYSDVK